ncbi:MAG: hypothetical protein EOL89_12100 [Actinobacteria bacterium]|nr:hypothetical protein [Actinomycetota bacterium]
MKLYADLPARRTRQIIADALVLLWVVIWVRTGFAVRDTVLGALGPARSLEAAGDSLQGSLADVAARVEGIPLLGEAISTPFDAAAAAGETMRQAGADLVAYVDRTALIAGVTTALLPVVLVVLPWLLFRIAFARRARALTLLLASEDPLDLLALRALATQPVGTLTRVSPTPAHDWRIGRPDVVAQLAALELRRAGVALDARKGPAGSTGGPLAPSPRAGQ